MMPLALATTVWFIRKHYGSRNAFLIGCLLPGSVAFYDSLVQPIPQGIEMILAPLALDSHLEKKWKRFVLFAGLMMWSHSVVSVAILGGLVIHALYERR